MADSETNVAGRVAAVDAVMRARRTDKVLANPDAPPASIGLARETVDAWLAAAAFAPFHYPAPASHREGRFNSCAPWRAYKLDAGGCRQLLETLRPDPAAGKILNMLAAAECLLQVTWTPEAETSAAAADGQIFAATQTNMEHLAAAGAAVQNLLLQATAAGWRTYWSSGGVLRGPAVFTRLGIPMDQVLIGSVFIFPPEVGTAEIMPGKLRDKRGGVADWSVWVS